MEIKWKQNKAPWHSFSLGTTGARVYEVVKAVTDLAQYILKRLWLEQMCPYVKVVDLGKTV